MSDQPLAFSKDVCLFILDDVGIVFSEPTQEIYELNTTATFIWCQLEEGLSEPELAEALAGTFGFRGADAHRFVREALADWRSRGFLGGEATAQRAAPDPKSTLSLDTRPIATRTMRFADFPKGSSIMRHYRVLDRSYRIFFASSEIETWVHPVLAHLEMPKELASEKSTDVFIQNKAEGFIIEQSGGRNLYRKSLREIAPLVKMILFSKAIGELEHDIAIHAGAVCMDDRALLLPGHAGSGKSTLTAALVHAELDYLSDDLIMLDASSGKVRGVPFALCVKETGLEALASLFPQLRDLPLYVRPDQMRVRYLPLPSARSEPSAQKIAEIHWIIFPTYNPEGRDELIVLPPAKALVRLTESCTMLRTVTKQSISGLLSLVSRSHCFGIEVSSLTKATDQLLTLIREARPKTRSIASREK